MSKSFFAKLIDCRYYMLYLAELRKQLKGCYSVLDLGCRDNSSIKRCPGHYSAGVDICRESLNMAMKNNTHNEYVLLDAYDIDKVYDDKSFDAVIMLGLIEHLNKLKAKLIIQKAERIARKKVIITTPNGFLAYGDASYNPFEVHLSGWSISDMRELGYSVKGMLGHKCFNNDWYNLKQPKVVYGVLSMLSHYFLTYHNPEKASDLFCVKEICEGRKS